MTGHKKGFTLIELAIVLVIIGLVAGSVLIGRDLIRSMQIRSQISQIENFNTATNSFRLKYDCLPGDCANAEFHGLGQASGPGENGNGDNSLLENPVSIRDKEMINFWYHLKQAGLINDNASGFTLGAPVIPGIHTPALKLRGNMPPDPVNFPTRNPQGGVLVVDSSQGRTAALDYEKGHLWYLTADSSWTVVQTLYQGQMLYAIDSKIDDGLPVTGTMKALGNRLSQSYAYFEALGYARCMIHTTDPVTYNLAASAQNVTNVILWFQFSCSALIQAEF
jgi:prepilin-type N-terminal cleavage/methylation domain-containing protein